MFFWYVFIKYKVERKMSFLQIITLIFFIFKNINGKYIRLYDIV